MISDLSQLMRMSFSKDEAMVQGFTIMGELQLYWKNCEESFLQSTYSQYYQSLVTPLSNVYSYILEYQVRAICYLSKKQLSRAWEKTSGQYDWATKEAYIFKLSDACNSQIQPLQKREAHKKFQEEMGKLDQIHQVGTDIVETIKDENQRHREQALMDKLELGGGDYLGGMNFNKDPVKGTCEWFYNGESLSSWLTSVGPGVFWVTAGPGCGKPVLARSLSKHGHLQSTTSIVDIGSQSPIESTEAIICYFFFKDETAERRSISTAMCAILHQLFSQDPTNRLIKQASGPFNGGAPPSSRSFDSLWEALLIVAKGHTGDIICVLDALDECRIDDRDQFIARLDQLHADQKASLNNLKFLITSRPYDDIELSFGPFLKWTEFFRFDADEHYKEISHDIGLVIDEMMDGFASNFDEADRQTIIDELKSRGTNTYLWLHLTLDIMKRHPSRYSRRRDVQTFLADLPSKVSEAYERILSRTESERTTKTLFQIMLAATRPLTVEEANYALTLALADHEIKTHSQLDSERWKGDFKSIVKNLCGLIVGVYDGRLSFIHLTVREFLTKKSNSGTTGWGGRFTDPTALHGTLARCCMKYLLLSEFALRQLLVIWSREGQYKLLHYAASSWPEHFQSADEFITSSYLPQARQLCDPSQQHVRTWGDVYMSVNRIERLQYREFCEWSHLSVASYVGLQAVVEDLVENIGVNVKELCRGNGTALHSAVAQDHESIAAYLVSKGAEVDTKPFSEQQTPLGIAVTLRQHRGIIQRLLENGASPLRNCEYHTRNTILDWAAKLPEKDIFYSMVASLWDIGTPDAIVSAITDQRIINSCDECVALLWDRFDDKRFGEETVLIEGRLKALMSVPYVGQRALRVFGEQNRQYLFIGKEILEAAANIQGIETFLRDFLAQNRQPCSYITQDVLETIARQYDPDTLRHFIQASLQGSFAIKNLILPATSNRRYFNTISLVIWEFAQAEIVADEELQKQILSKHYNLTWITRSIINFFLQFPRLNPSIKRRLIHSILECYRYSGQQSNGSLLRSVLELGERSDVVDSKILEKAVAYSSATAVQLLLEYSSGISLADERYLIAAARSSRCGNGVMEFLLSKYGSDAVITANVARTAVGERGGIFELLLKTRSKEVPITASIVSRVQTKSTLNAILQYREDDMARIANRTLHKVSYRRWFESTVKEDLGLARNTIMEDLLESCPVDWFEPTETLILNILEGNDIRKISQISTLIKTFGDKFELTEAIIAAAVAFRYDRRVPDIFKNWKPDCFNATPWIIEKTAAGGSFQGLDYLVEVSKGTLKIDEKWYKLAHFRDRAGKYPWEGYKRAYAEVSTLDVSDVYGRTALHVALSKHDVPLRVVRFLLETTNADVHAVDRRGWTALHFAVFSWNIELVQMLLVAGADPYKAALDGKTPISLVKGIKDATRQSIDRRTLLMVLKDEWFAGFMSPTFGIEDDDQYHEQDDSSDEESNVEDTDTDPKRS